MVETAGASKNNVIENFGKRVLPLRQSWPPALAPLAAPAGALAFAASSFSDDERLTRWTPSIRRRLEMTPATLSWLVVQPVSSMAGAGTKARSGSVTPPSTAVVGVTVP